MLPLLFFTIVSLASGALAWFDVSSKQNVAVYWGQNSLARTDSQDRLVKYCDNPDVDIVILSFLTQFHGVDGNPVLNFANQGLTESPYPVKCTLFPGSGLFKCPELEQDIQTCQRKMGKTVLLSIGGATYNEGGFPTSDVAIAEANKIWAMFGPPQDGIYHPYKPKVLRPFGYASVDGFDFDFEGPNTNSAAFGNRLRQLMDEYKATYGRTFFLAAAPQCPHPDVWMKDLLENVPLDLVMVQFYNNFCGVSNFVPGTKTQNNYNFEAWDQWAHSTSKNKNVKIMVGVPANDGAGQGYISPAKLSPVLDHSVQYGSYTGVMIWDASQAWGNNNFQHEIKTKAKAAANKHRKREVLRRKRWTKRARVV